MIQIWNREIKDCATCPYSESFSGEWKCKYDKHEITTGFNLYVDENCSFIKPITKKVIKSFGFVIIKELDYSINAQLLPENPFKFYELDYDLDDNELLIEKFYQSKLLGQPMDKDTFNSRTIFNGIINNPEELKFILKKLNIIE